jgi:hypothetical protein
MPNRSSVCACRRIYNSLEDVMGRAFDGALKYASANYPAPKLSRHHCAYRQHRAPRGGLAVGPGDTTAAR